MNNKTVKQTIYEFLQESYIRESNDYIYFRNELQESLEINDLVMKKSSEAEEILFYISSMVLIGDRYSENYSDLTNDTHTRGIILDKMEEAELFLETIR